MCKYLILFLLWCSSAVAATPAPLDAGAIILSEVTGLKVRNYSTQDFGRTINKAGRSVLVKEAVAERTVIELRKRLPARLIAFVGVTNYQTTPRPEGVEVVVAEGRDQFDILRVAAAGGSSHTPRTEDLIRELRKWDEEVGIDIWQAQTDTIQIKLRTAPKDPLAFAKRVYKFCPDIVDEGSGSVKTLAKLIAKDKAISLWWSWE